MHLIVFEGIDGTGKTCQSLLLEESFRASNKKVIRYAEPSNSVHGKKIRDMMEKKIRMSPEDEMQLFIDDRKYDVEKNIIPSIKSGYTVIMDRYYFSNAAYQGATGRYNWKDILTENEAFAPKPDILFIFIIDIKEAIKRIENARNGKTTSMEKAERLSKVQEIYLKMHESGKYKSRIIDTANSIMNIERMIHETLEKMTNG